MYPYLNPRFELREDRRREAALVSGQMVSLRQDIHNGMAARASPGTFLEAIVAMETSNLSENEMGAGGVYYIC